MKLVSVFVSRQHQGWLWCWASASTHFADLCACWHWIDNGADAAAGVGASDSTCAGEGGGTGASHIAGTGIGAGAATVAGASAGVVSGISTWLVSLGWQQRQQRPSPLPP